jgi:hypothetical protein
MDPVVPAPWAGTPAKNAHSAPCSTRKTRTCNHNIYHSMPRYGARPGRYGAGMAHTVASIGFVYYRTHYDRLSWIMNDDGLSWIVMDYKLSWAIMDYHGFWTIMALSWILDIMVDSALS